MIFKFQQIYKNYRITIIKNQITIILHKSEQKKVTYFCNL